MLALASDRLMGHTRHVLVFLAILFLAGHVNLLYCAEPSSNKLDVTLDSTAAPKTASSYEQVLRVWKTPEDINQWIAANFSYDAERALQLSETQRASNERISVYDPSAFFDKKTGMCVDLSRFALETLRRIEPGSSPKYLMIEFSPTVIKGNVLRLHWLVSFKRDGNTYFFADSNRPGHIAGPYTDLRGFISDYEQHRGRKIAAFRELESYQKQQRTPTLKRQPQEKKP